MRELKLPNIETVARAEAESEVGDVKDQIIKELGSEAIDELEQQQDMNEIIANIPQEFKVDGRTIKVNSKSAREMVKIDKAIMRLLKLQFNRESIQIENNDNFWDDLDNIQNDYYDATFEVISLIINDNPKEPEFDLDWIMDHIDLFDGGVGEQILDAYNAKCSSQGFFQKVLRSRKF